MDDHGCPARHGSIPKWMIYKGKSQSKMDDEQGYPPNEKKKKAFATHPNCTLDVSEKTAIRSLLVFNWLCFTHAARPSIDPTSRIWWMLVSEISRLRILLGDSSHES